VKAIKIFLITLLSCLFITSSATASAVIGQYEIPLSMAATPESAINACLAATYMNQTIVNPGEIFSFNKAVGERTPARYFVPAPISTLSKTPVYDYGGGICMTASILHKAVINAGLVVVERHNHVTRVEYLPPGEDAAVVWGRQDYRFKNTRSNPVRINAVFTQYNTLRIELHEVPAKEEV